jgi:hypothetical protein
MSRDGELRGDGRLVVHTTLAYFASESRLPVSGRHQYMMPINRTGVARCRNAIVSVAVAAMMVLCSGRGTAWAADKSAPTPSAAPETAGTRDGPASGVTVAEGATTPSLAETYATREANARELQNFRGGDVVIVGTTGVIVVLLVIIILLSL